MTKKKTLFLIILAVVVFLGLAITFLFTDLQISIALASNNLKNPNFFLKLFASIGEFPIYVGPVLFGLIYGTTNKTKTWKLVAHFVGFMCTYVGWYRMSGEAMEVFFHTDLGLVDYIVMSIAALLSYLLFYLLISKVKVETLLKLRDIALIMLIVSAASFAGTQVTKYVFGRTRFRALDSTYSEYSNFLTIREFLGGLKGDDYRSFPSGHTGSATCLIMLTMIPYRLSKNKWFTYLTLLVTFLYALVVALSRVCIGAHYASDVLFGFGLTIVCFILAYFIFDKKGWLNARGN